MARRNIRSCHKVAVLFYRVAITNYHKFGGLKQQKFIVSQFWRPQV